jgi:hypothetical protein
MGFWADTVAEANVSAPNARTNIDKAFLIPITFLNWFVSSNKNNTKATRKPDWDVIRNFVSNSRQYLALPTDQLVQLPLNITLPYAQNSRAQSPHFAPLK